MIRRTTMSLSVVACCMAPLAAVAQSVYAQDATVTANATTVSGQYLPVVSSTGTASYFNFTTTIAVDASGNPSATTVFSPSPKLLFDGLQVGKYMDDGYNATLSGPGIGPSGTTEWSWSGDYNLGSAAFYVGPIAKNPLAARIKKAGITYTGYTYGISGGGGTNWASNCLVGIAQTGNALTLVSFSNSGCTQDYPMPQAQMSWQLSAP